MRLSAPDTMNGNRLTLINKIRWHLGLAPFFVCPSDDHTPYIRNLRGDDIWKEGGFRSMCTLCTARWDGPDGEGTAHAYWKAFDPNSVLIFAIFTVSTTVVVLGVTSGSLLWRIPVTVAAVAVSALVEVLALGRIRRYAVNARSANGWRLSIMATSMIGAGVLIRNLVWPVSISRGVDAALLSFAYIMVSGFAGFVATALLCMFIDRFFPVKRSDAATVRAMLVRANEYTETAEQVGTLSAE